MGYTPFGRLPVTLGNYDAEQLITAWNVCSSDYPLVSAWELEVPAIGQ